MAPTAGTRSYAVLDVRPESYDEIHGKLEAAGYRHAFRGGVIDMHGLALRRGATEARFWDLVPTPWVRESNKDKWKPRDRVLRYRAFRDEIRLRKVWLPNPGDLVVFMMPIPRSWSQKKRLEADGQAHESRPDTDNLMKALLDACYAEDAHIWTMTPAKVWSLTPGIYIERREPLVRLPFTLERV